MKLSKVEWGMDRCGRVIRVDGRNTYNTLPICGTARISELLGTTDLFRSPVKTSKEDRDTGYKPSIHPFYYVAGRDKVGELH